MKLLADIQGDIRAMMKGELEAAERAVTAGVSEAASGLQQDWRRQITGAALGQGLANSIRKKLYPTGGASIRAAAVVYSNASKVVDAFDRGALIRTKNGFWLAIPTAAAGKKGVGNKRITPGGWEQRTGQRLRFGGVVCGRQEGEVKFSPRYRMGARPSMLCSPSSLKPASGAAVT